MPLVDYADGEDASPFGQMLGGLIEANVESRPEKRGDFDAFRARVGIQVIDIEEAITLDFKSGHLRITNGLLRDRKLTIRTDSETVLELSNLGIGPLGLPVYVDSIGRGVVSKLLTGRLRIDGMLTNVGALNRLTRIFSVR